MNNDNILFLDQPVNPAKDVDAPLNNRLWDTVHEAMLRVDAVAREGYGVWSIERHHLIQGITRVGIQAHNRNRVVPGDQILPVRIFSGDPDPILNARNNLGSSHHLGSTTSAGAS